MRAGWAARSPAPRWSSSTTSAPGPAPSGWAPLVYFPQPGGSILIIASRRGGPTDPDWYHNLKANPKIDVEVAPTASP